MNPTDRKSLMTSTFVEHFGESPTLWSQAPGRVDLMGSHTDYNMGYVMTMTIDRTTWIAARPRSDRQVRIRSLNVAGESTFGLDQVERDEQVPWSNYVRGIAYVLQQAGHDLQGFDALIDSTVPFGSGLSSSAALEMATAVLFQKTGSFELDPVVMAQAGQKAENEFVGVNTGILDQYSSAMGQAGCAIQLDCRQLTSELVSIHPDLAVVICDTRAERNLVGSEYDDRRGECEEGVRILQQHDPSIQALRDVSPAQFDALVGYLPPTVAKRCRFIVEENQRVLDLASPLTAGDRETLAALFATSYAGARDLFEIGAPAMQAMIEAMNSAPGVVAARQTGAGFGGCMVALVQNDSVSDFSDHVAATYEQATGIQPRIFDVKPAPGAGLLNY